MKYILVLFSLLAHSVQADEKINCDEKVKKQIENFLTVYKLSSSEAKISTTNLDIKLNDFIKAYKENEKAIDALSTTVAQIKKINCGFKPGVKGPAFKGRVDCEDNKNLSTVFRMEPTYLMQDQAKMGAFEVMAQKLKSLCNEDPTFCDTNGLPSSELLQLSNSDKKSHSNSDKKSQYSVRRYEYEESTSKKKNQVKVVLVDGKPVRYFIRDKFRITLDDNCEIKNTTQLAMHLDASSCKESEDEEVKSFCQALGILSRPYYSPTPNPRGMPTSPPSNPVPNPTGRKTGS